LILPRAGKPCMPPPLASVYNQVAPSASGLYHGDMRGRFHRRWFFKRLLRRRERYSARNEIQYRLGETGRLRKRRPQLDHNIY